MKYAFGVILGLFCLGFAAVVGTAEVTAGDDGTSVVFWVRSAAAVSGLAGLILLAIVWHQHKLERLLRS